MLPGKMTSQKIQKPSNFSTAQSQTLVGKATKIVESETDSSSDDDFITDKSSTTSSENDDFIADILKHEKSVSKNAKMSTQNDATTSSQPVVSFRLNLDDLKRKSAADDDDDDDLFAEVFSEEKEVNIFKQTHWFKCSLTIRPKF